MEDRVSSADAWPGALVEEERAGGDPIAEDGLMEADRRPNASRQLPIR